jgi:hypothetical protein
MAITKRRKKRPNPTAAALAKMRWSKTSPEERTAAARKAVQARWSKVKKGKPTAHGSS